MYARGGQENPVYVHMTVTVDKRVEVARLSQL